MSVQEGSPAGQEAKRSVLLVVDDETAVCRAVARVMRRHFDEVVTADSPNEARAVFATRTVTHLICDHWFGKGQPLGLDLVTTWVQEHAALTRVLLLTGVDIAMLISPDPKVRIIPKTAEAADLLRELGVG